MMDLFLLFSQNGTVRCWQSSVAYCEEERLDLFSSFIAFLLYTSFTEGFF